MSQILLDLLRVKRKKLLKVTIENLTFECIIGILESERKDEQKVIINLSLNISLMKIQKSLSTIQK